MQAPDPHRQNRPHKQEGGTDVPGFRNQVEGAPLGHRPRKELGQHFLTDLRVLDDIVAAARLQPGQTVLEIGPGPGQLTRRLAQAIAPTGQLVAIEADRSLAAALQGQGIAGLTIHVGDAVQTDLARPTGAATMRFDRIVANLPYLISGPITAAFLDLLAQPATRWGLAVLMFQREFAERLLAAPGSGDYGRLTVHAARHVRVTKVRDVPPGAFQPPPRVESMVVRLEPHDRPPFEVADEALWRAAVDGTFQRRRKQLRNSLPMAVGGVGVPREAAIAALEARGWAERRPENLAPGEFAQLVGDLAAQRRPGAPGRGSLAAADLVPTSRGPGDEGSDE